MAKGASSLLDDIGNDVDFKTSLHNRGHEVLSGLKKRAYNEMSGEGYTTKVNKKIKTTHSLSGRGKKQSKKKTSTKSKKKKKTKKTAVKKKTKAKPKKKKNIQLAARNPNFFKL